MAMRRFACHSANSYIANLIIASAQIARRGTWAINRISLRIKSLQTLEKLAIRNYWVLTIKTGPTVYVQHLVCMVVTPY